MEILPGLTLENKKTEDGQEVFTLDHRLVATVRDKKKKDSVDERRLDGSRRSEKT